MDHETQEQKIWCAVVGDTKASAAIRIHTSSGDEVEDLKERIYKKGKRRFACLDSSDLVLWKLIVSTESFNSPCEGADLSEIAVELEDPMVKVSTLGFVAEGVQILVQDQPPCVEDLNPRQRPRLSGDNTIHDDAWPSKAWAAGWGQPATATHSNGYSMMPTGLRTSLPVFVRGEYEDIWKHIESQLRRSVKHAGGLVVWGQPGIGKSSFLLFALAKALEHMLPVVFCDKAHSFYLFDEHGPHHIRLAALDLCPLPENTLVLYDSHGSGEPPSEFTDPESTAFVVQATSPRVARWKGWRKRRGAHVWTMGLWTKEEIVAASQVLSIKVDPEYYSPLELYYLLGPSPRHCLYALGYTPQKNTGDPEHDLSSFINLSLRPSDADKIVSCMAARAVTEESQGFDFDVFFYARRSPRIANPNRAPHYTYDVPTRFLRQLLSVALVRAHLVHRITNAAQVMSYHQIAGITYEPVVMKKLSSPGDALHCQFHNGSRFDLPCPLEVSKDTASFHQPFAPQSNTLYIPPLAYPAIDAVAITHQGQRVTLLHITTAQEQSVELDGIKEVMSSLGRKASAVCWAFIFVTPSAEWGRALSRAAHPLQVRREALPKRSKEETNPPTFMTQIDVGWAVVEQRDEAFQAVMVGAIPTCTEATLADVLGRKREE